MAGEVGVAGCLCVALRLSPGPHAVEEVADVEGGRVTADLFDLAAREQLRRREYQLAAVACLDPARGPLESYRAGAKWNPALLPEHEFDSVSVAADQFSILWRQVFHRRRAVVDGPLAEIDTV